MAEPTKLPFDLFTTERFDPRQRFEAWREAASSLFDVYGREGMSTAQGFDATLASYHLGDLIVMRADFDAQRFDRPRRKLAADGLDHYQVQLYASGRESGVANDRDLEVRPGDVQILDLGRPVATKTEACKTVALFVPRDVLHAALPGADDLHGRVLRGDSGPGGLLADYMTSLVRRADSMTTADAAPVATASVALVAACLRPTADGLAQARSQIDEVTLERIKRHIDERVTQSGLGPDALCAQFGISRARLYRLFEADGGVARYIQSRRLRRALVALGSPDNGQRRIIDVALDLGFTSEAHFSRLFRRAYGVTPSEVRHHPYPRGTAGGDRGHSGSRIAGWLAGLQRSG
jgi:AraC-like DNA-binding protein